MPKALKDMQDQILNQFSSDDEDEDQLGTGGGDDNEDEDEDDTDSGDDDASDDDDESEDEEGDDEDDEDGGEDDEEDDETDVDDEPAPKKAATDPVVNKDKFKFKSDRHGNLVDANGKILFTAGKSRTVFEQLKTAFYKANDGIENLKGHYAELHKGATKLLADHKELQKSGGIQKQHGLTDDEVQEAMNFRAQIKLDPKAAIRSILTKLSLAGTDLKDLGVTGPLDPKAVAEHVLAEQQRRNPPPESDEDRIKKEVTDFLGRHPDAERHVQLVGNAKARYPHMTLDQIWTRIQVEAAKRGTKKPKKEERPERSARNKTRRENTSRRKLSLEASDPRQSFEQIGAGLLKDLQSLERR